MFGGGLACVSHLHGCATGLGAETVREHAKFVVDVRVSGSPRCSVTSRCTLGKISDHLEGFVI